MDVQKEGHPLDKLEDEEEFPFIVVAPKGTGEYSIWEPDEVISAVMTLLDEVQAVVAVNSSRIYLTGESAGGNGTWVIGLRYPDRFAALVPVMGYYGWPFAVRKTSAIWWGFRFGHSTGRKTRSSRWMQSRVWLTHWKRAAGMSRLRFSRTLGVTSMSDGSTPQNYTPGCSLKRWSETVEMDTGPTWPPTDCWWQASRLTRYTDYETLTLPWIYSLRLAVR
jgi:predicted peptidase